MIILDISEENKIFTFFTKGGGGGNTNIRKSTQVNGGKPI